MHSDSVDEMYENSSKNFLFMRIDKSINPTKMRAATVCPKELKNLSLIKNIIRNGRIEKIEKTKIVLNSGKDIPTNPETLHIDFSQYTAVLSVLPLR